MPNTAPVSANNPSIPVTSAAPAPSRLSGTVADAITTITNTSESRASEPQQVVSSSVSGSNTPAASGRNLLHTIMLSVQKSFEVKQPTQKRARSPADDATRHSPPPKKGLKPVMPLSGSVRADGSEPSAPRPAHRAGENAVPQKPDKPVPYFSGGCDENFDLNGEAEDDCGNVIECRHLATYWEEQFRATGGRVNYDRINTPDNILRNVPADQYQQAHDRPAVVHLVNHEGWGEMIARTFREMEKAGENIRTLSTNTPSHAMALGLKIKQTGTGPRQVIQFYDPNRTTTHKRVAVSGSDLSAIQRLTATDFIEPEDLNDYSSEGNVTAFLDRQTPVTRHQTGHVQTENISSQEMHLALRYGLDDHIASLAEQILSMQPEETESFLQAQATDEDMIIPGLTVALQEGQAEAIREWGEILLNSGLSEDQRTTLLDARRSDGESGLLFALQEGQADAIRAWGEVLLRSKLTQEQRAMLLHTVRPDGTPGLYMALLNGQADAIRAWGKVLLNSGLNAMQRTELLSAREMSGVPGLYCAVNKGHTDAIREWGEILLNSGLSEDQRTTLLDARRSDGESGLLFALQEGQADAIRAWGEVLLNSKLSQSQCAMLLHTVRSDGVPGLYLALMNGQVDTIRAWGQVLLSSGLNAMQRAELLSARDLNGVPGLYWAIEDGHTDAIRAYAELARDAGFTPESLAALLAEGRPDILQQALEAALGVVNRTEKTPAAATETRPKALAVSSDAPDPIPVRLPVPDRAAGLADAQQLRAAQLATPGNWNNEGGELMPFLLAAEFPQVTFHVLNGNQIQTFNDGQSQAAYLIREGSHYTPWVTAAGGTRRQEAVPPDGDCFFASAFFAVHNRPALPAEIQAMRERFSRRYAGRADYYDRCLSDPDLINTVSVTRELAVSRADYHARVASGQPVRLDEVTLRHAQNASPAAPAPASVSQDAPPHGEPEVSLREDARVQQAVSTRMADLAAAVAGASGQTALPDIVVRAREYRMLDTLNQFVRRSAVHQENTGRAVTDAYTDAVLNVLLTEEQNYRLSGDHSWQPQAYDGLTQADIRNAIDTVKLQQAEGEFELWLDGWAPWQTYLNTLTDAERSVTDAQLATAGRRILSHSGELTRLAHEARTDRTRQALMHATDQEINRTWSYGDPVDINEDRTQKTFRESLRLQAELLGTPRHSQAADYLSSRAFLQEATRAMDFSDEAFSATADDRILLLQTLTQAVQEATPEGVARIHAALFHPGRRHENLIHNLFRSTGSVSTSRERDAIARIASNLIHLLDAIVDRQLPDNPQARADMQAQIADARVIFTSDGGEGYSLLSFYKSQARPGWTRTLALALAPGAAREMLRTGTLHDSRKETAKAVISALHQTDLLPDAETVPGLEKILQKPVAEEHMALLNSAVSAQMAQKLNKTSQTDPSREGRQSASLAALVHALAPVVRQECARPFDMPTACRFMALHDRVTSKKGADMLYRAEYLGLIARALVNPENHSLAVFALSNPAVQQAMRASPLTRTDFEWLVRAGASLTENRSADAEHSTMEWNNPDFIQNAVSLGEQYHVLSSLDVRADWNRDRLHQKVTALLKEAAGRQLHAALKAAYKKKNLLLPGDSEMRRITEKTWDRIKDKWIAAGIKEAEGVFEQEAHRILAYVATTRHNDPQIAGEIQYVAADIATGGRLAGAVLSGREQSGLLPQASTDDPEMVRQLYHDMTDRLGRAITEGEDILGMPHTTGTARERLRWQGMHAVQEDIDNLVIVNNEGIMAPGPDGILRGVQAFPTLYLRPATDAGGQPQRPAESLPLAAQSSFTPTFSANATGIPAVSGIPDILQVPDRRGLPEAELNALGMIYAAQDNNQSPAASGATARTVPAPVLSPTAARTPATVSAQAPVQFQHAHRMADGMTTSAGSGAGAQTRRPAVPGESGIRPPAGSDGSSGMPPAVARVPVLSHEDQARRDENVRLIERDRVHTNAQSLDERGVDMSRVRVAGQPGHTGGIIRAADRPESAADNRAQTVQRIADDRREVSAGQSYQAALDYRPPAYNEADARMGARIENRITAIRRTHAQEQLTNTVRTELTSRKIDEIVMKDLKITEEHMKKALEELAKKNAEEEKERLKEEEKKKKEQEEAEKAKKAEKERQRQQADTGAANLVLRPEYQESSTQADNAAAGNARVRR